MTCTASKCRCNRCGTTGYGDQAAALLREQERRLAREKKAAEYAASREKAVAVPPVGYPA